MAERPSRRPRAPGFIVVNTIGRKTVVSILGWQRLNAAGPDIFDTRPRAIQFALMLAKASGFHVLVHSNLRGAA